MKKCIFICLTCVLAMNLQAQIFDSGLIKGRLVDEQKTSVPNATILLKRTLDSGIHKTALSSDSGLFYFDLLKEGSYFIEITIIGFEQVTKRNITISGEAPEFDLGIVELAASSGKMKEITITAQAPFIERRIDRMVVNVENSILATGSAVLEMLAKMPGVQVRQDGEINLNGKSGVQVMIDGKPTQLSPEDLASLLRTMPSSNIQKVELMARPSARYEAAGSGGIINIITKKNRREGLNGSVNGGVGYGRRPRYNGGFDLGFRNGKYNLYLGGAYLFNRILRVSGSSVSFYNNNNLDAEFISDNTQLRDNRAFTPTAGLDIYLTRRTTLSFSAGGSFRSVRTNADSYSEEFNAASIKTGIYDFTNDSKDHFDNYSFGMRLARQLDTSGRSVTVDLDYSNYRGDSYQEMLDRVLSGSGGFISDSNRLLDQRGRLKIYSLKADYQRPLAGDAKLEAGWKSSYVHSGNNNDFFRVINGTAQVDLLRSSHFRYTELINAAYVNFNREYKKVNLQLGLRLEQTIGKGEQLLTKQVNRQDFIQLFPSLFFEYKISDENSLNIQMGRRTDRPAYADKNPLRRIINAISYIEGDPYLLPQLSYNNTVTYSYHSSLFVSLGYTWYQNYITKSSFPDPNANITGLKPINIRNSYSYNLELLYSKKLKPWWSTNSNLFVYYRYFNGSINSDFLDNEGIPSFYVTTNNNFSLSEKTSAELAFWYEHSYQEAASVFRPAYSLSLGVKRMLFEGRGALSANISDIFWTEPYNWSTSFERMKEVWYAKNDTRVFKLNFSYRFGKGKAAKLRKTTASDEEKNRAATGER